MGGQLVGMVGQLVGIDGAKDGSELQNLGVDKGLRVSTASSPNVLARSARSVFLFNWQQNG
jgi:hypothetical protein